MNLGWTMLSMVNANRFINMAVIPLVIVAYAVFLWIDYNPYRYPENKVHMQNIKNIGAIDGLVFGGSNAVYSLSAESLSYFTGVKLYNVSVMAELRNVKRHKNFIKDFSALIDRMRVRYVVYSSFIPYEIGEIAAVKSDKSEQGLRIKPKKSVLAYIKKSVLVYIKDRNKGPQRNSYGDLAFDDREQTIEALRTLAYIKKSVLEDRNKAPQRNSYGDLVFDDRVKCDFSDDRASSHKREDIDIAVAHKREDIDLAVDFLGDMAIFFTSVFPYASIQIVLPSDYYGLSFDDSIFEQTLRKKFYGFLPDLTNSIKIIFQPPYSSMAQVCTAGGHANEDGRLWRTRNLVESMFDTPQQQVSIR